MREVFTGAAGIVPLARESRARMRNIQSIQGTVFYLLVVMTTLTNVSKIGNFCQSLFPH
eukprot:COSAG02_NODE_29884_length_561_cov_0.777056_1_plen_58_part_10